MTLYLHLYCWGVSLYCLQLLAVQLLRPPLPPPVLPLHLMHSLLPGVLQARH
jgi:hypothetical protein